MPRRKAGTPPAYRKHSSGQARVGVRLSNGERKDILLGVYGSPQSHDEYKRVLTVLNQNGGTYPKAEEKVAGSARGGLTINEVILTYLKEQGRVRGEGNHEYKEIVQTLRPLRRLFGTSPADEFSPKGLRAVLRVMADGSWLTDAEQCERKAKGHGIGCCRNVLKRRLSRIKAMFNWSVSEELVNPAVAHAIRTVKAVEPHDKSVRSTPPQQPAFWKDVEQVAPHCPSAVGTMLRLQFLAGMRSGEVRVMRTCDLDRTDPDCWVYRPGSDAGPYGKHKNAWRGQSREIPLGKQCVEILTPWLLPDEPDRYLFSPHDSVERRNQLRRATRTTPMTPSQRARQRKTTPKRKPGRCYSDESYPRAVSRACAVAGVKFRPYALRHGRKMDVERKEGSEAARVMLGQKSIQSTTHYGTLDLGHAVEVARKMG